MRNKKLQFIFLTIILYLLHLFGRFFGLFNYFLVTGTVNLFLTFYLLKVNPYKKIGLFIIFFPFFVLTGTVIYGITNSLRMPGIIGYFMYIFSSISSFILLVLQKKKAVILIYFILLSLLIINYGNFINYYYFTDNKSTKIGNKLPKIKVLDSNNKIQILNNNGKILVIDLWSNTCGNCIKDFPKFEMLKNDFADEPSVDFISINILNKKSDIIESKKILKKYTFKKYFTDRSVFKKLDFNSIPNYMIVGKDGKIKYFGNLNVERYETFNNIYKLIENEK